MTNDDGIHAPGLDALVRALSEIGEVMVVAPATEMSAVGHAITLSDPLRVTKFFKNGHLFGYAVNGTPADCVKLAYWALLKEAPKPDLLVSGINLGTNTGINTIYSGTVSAATEGAILGIPSFAISLASYTHPVFEPAARFALKMARTLLKRGLPPGIFLNINVPPIPEHEIAGVCITRQGMASYREEFQKRKDPHLRDYYWLTGEKKEIETDERVDDRAILQKKISITPVHYDLTYYPILQELESWTEDLQ